MRALEAEPVVDRDEADKKENNTIPGKINNIKFLFDIFIYLRNNISTYILNCVILKNTLF